jgi:Family of unknown function (DUF5984)
MIFEFQLTPIEDIHPWGKPPNLSLSWFGFTLGEYRIKVGSEYLLNYSNEFTNHLHKKFPEYLSKTTFVDYQVVRLWEDILAMFPFIIEPVPEELHHFLNSGYKNYSALRNKTDAWQESETAKSIGEDESWKIADKTDFWLNERWLDSAYLSPSARIWIWSDENDVIFSWDNREITVENIPVWTAVQGNYRINKEDFINEVRKFNKNLISQMNERVETICHNWNKAEIKVDIEYLKNEQKNRATWFEPNPRNILKTDWDEVISAIKIINS